MHTFIPCPVQNLADEALTLLSVTVWTVNVKRSPKLSDRRRRSSEGNKNYGLKPGLPLFPAPFSDETTVLILMFEQSAKLEI